MAASLVTLYIEGTDSSAVTWLKLENLGERWEDPASVMIPLPTEWELQRLWGKDYDHYGVYHTDICAIRYALVWSDTSIHGSRVTIA